MPEFHMTDPVLLPTADTALAGPKITSGLAGRAECRDISRRRRMCRPLKED
jgi:hypothetical protein